MLTARAETLLCILTVYDFFIYHRLLALLAVWRSMTLIVLLLLVWSF